MAHDRHAEVFRAAYDKLVEPAPETLDWAELEARVAEASRLAPPFRTPSDRRPVWVLVAAAIATLVLIGGGAWLLFSTQPEPPVITQEPIPTAMQWEKASVPQSSNEPASGLWEQVMNAVTSDGNRLLAGGAARYEPAVRAGWVAAVWVSDDGHDWDRVPHEDEVFGGPDEHYVINDITPGGPGYVAVGQLITPESYEPGFGATASVFGFAFGFGMEFNEAAAWVSEDGLSWTRIESTSFGGPYAQMTGVAPGGPGLVAVGNAASGAAVWTSPNGIDWQLADTAFPPDTGLWDVIQSGGRLIAVGNQAGRPYMWLSEDGIAWEPQAVYQHDERAYGADTWVATYVDGSPIAAGRYYEWGNFGRQVAGVWHPGDDGAWERVPTFTDSARGANIQGLAATEQGLVAAGYYMWPIGYQLVWDGTAYLPDPNLNPSPSLLPARAAIWISTDGGVTWSEVPNDDGEFGDDSADTPGAAMFAIVPFGDGLVAVGADGAEAVAWIGEWTD